MRHLVFICFDNPNPFAALICALPSPCRGWRRGARCYSAAALTAFGEGDAAFFTGKPQVPGLGRAFLFRNYRPDFAKWQTADPLGYPDGWNQLAYGPNSPAAGIDLFGAGWKNEDFVYYYFNQDPSRSNKIDTDQMGLTDAVRSVIRESARNKIDLMVGTFINNVAQDRGQNSCSVNIQFSVACGSIVWAMGGGIGRASGQLFYKWEIEHYWDSNHLYEKMTYYWQFNGSLTYSDSFRDPADILNLIEMDIEIPYGRPYDYGHVWNSQFLDGDGYLRASMIE